MIRMVMIVVVKYNVMMIIVEHTLQVTRLTYLIQHTS